MTDNTELQRLVDRVLTDRRFCGDENHKALADGVQVLIAENERLKTLRSTTERDLAQELQVWRHGPSCWNCGDTGDVHDIVGEWRGKCDCNAAKLIDVAYERDQLRAEVSGLKTGYQAYERVNAELKAEVEGLRKFLLDASEEIADWGAYASAYFQEKHDLAGCVAKFHAAAMGKGEQS
jgi:hypothetical protein